MKIRLLTTRLWFAIALALCVSTKAQNDSGHVKWEYKVVGSEEFDVLLKSILDKDKEYIHLRAKARTEMRESVGAALERAGQAIRDTGKLIQDPDNEKAILAEEQRRKKEALQDAKCKAREKAALKILSKAHAKALNKYGQEGWECIGHTKKVGWIFKRRKKASQDNSVD